MKRKTKKMNMKSNLPIKEIDQLHACIQSDQSKLAKLYEKIATYNQKSIVRLDKQLAKLKPKTAKMGKGKRKQGPKTNQKDQKNRAAVQKELGALKTEHASLSAGYKKFLAQQKALQLFEKEWQKKSIKVGKPKAKHKQKAVRTKKRPEMTTPKSNKNKVVEDVIV